MGKTIIWTSITVLFFALIEAAILSNLEFLPVVPDLVLLVVLYVSFMNSSTTGSTVGFISGIFLDFLSASPIGLNAFTKTVTGFIFGKLSGSFNLHGVVIPAFMGGVATIIKALLTWALSFIFKSGIIPYSVTGQTFWFELIANTICAPIIFVILGIFKNFFVADRRGIE